MQTASGVISTAMGYKTTASQDVCAWLIQLLGTLQRWSFPNEASGPVSIAIRFL